MATASDLQQLYVGYFGRAADQVGLDFWLDAINNGGLSLDNVHASFVQSAEYNALYEGLSNSELVTQVYLNVLGRGVEDEGLAFWAGALDAGTITQDQLIEGLLSGLSAKDALIVQNKVTVANYYTSQVGAAYAEADKAQSAAIIATVDASLTSVADALEEVGDVVPGGVPDALATALAQAQAAQDALQAYATALLGDDAADPADPAADVAAVEARYGATPSQLTADINKFNAASAVDIAAGESAAVIQQKITEATTKAQTAVTTAQNALNTTVGPALVNSYNAALARFETAEANTAAAELAQVRELAGFNAIAGSVFVIDAATGTAENAAGDDLFVLNAQNKLVLDSAFAAGATPAQVTAANALLGVVQARLDAVKAEDVASDALLVQARLVDAKDNTMTGADIDADGVITGGLIKALADAKTAQTALADAVKDLAETNAIIAEWAELNEGVDDANTAVSDLGYNPVDYAAGALTLTNNQNDVVVVDTTDGTIDASIASGEFQKGDLLYVGAGYQFGGASSDTVTTQAQLLAGGSTSVLEVFFEQAGANAIVHIETKAFANGAAAPANDLVSITLTGVNVEDLAFDNGFVSIVA